MAIRPHALFPLLLAVLLLTGCASFGASSIPSALDASSSQEGESVSSPDGRSSVQDPAPDPDPRSQAEILLDSLTLREKVGQLFAVRPNALRPDGAPATEVTEEMRQTLALYPAGGVIQFGENIVSPDQLSAFNLALQRASRIPLLLGVDEEGGTVARLASHPAFALPRYGSAAAVGESGDPAAAREMGETIGAYLKEYGFQVDFAPVADVNTNPDNPVIGRRAFSSDPSTAAEMAGAMAEGLRSRGILPVFKHFPGHGDTAQDSHSGMAVSERTREQMLSCEWLPFWKADDLDGVMVGHISVPALTGDNTPATLSDLVVTGMLRGLLGFQGLVFTDSMEMGAITEQYGPEIAAVRALLAGCDIILMPADLPAAFDGVLSAVEEGILSEERLNESVLRILEAKERLGLLEPDFLPPEEPLPEDADPAAQTGPADVSSAPVTQPG